MRVKFMGRIIAVTLCLSLAMPMAAAWGAASEEQHWVYGELKEYKQLLVPKRDESLAGKGPITPEEWKSFQADVLDAQKLDQPITPANWATALKLAVRLPQDQADSLLSAYVYGLVAPNAADISRETAVGGMVKLLTVETIRGEWRAGGARDAAKQLEDYKDIDDKQSGLVAIAYRDNVLDASVKTKFRPKERLTHAEAISMLDHVMITYRDVSRSAQWLQSHWSTAEMTGFLNGYGSTDNIALTGLLQSSVPSSIAQLDQPVPAGLWHLLLLAALKLPTDNKATDYNAQLEDYTLRMADGMYIDRGHAVIGLTKLGGPRRDVTQQEIDDAVKAFTDFGDAADKSKLAVAYREGLIGGYGDGTFKPHNDLTYGEAFVLAVRLSQRGAKP